MYGGTNTCWGLGANLDQGLSNRYHNLETDAGISQVVNKVLATPLIKST